MRVRYLSLHKLLGANKLVDGVDAEIFSSSRPDLRAYVTEKPDEVLGRFDHTSALSKLILTAFTGSTPGMTSEQSLDEEVARLASERRTGGVYVVFDGTTEVEQPELTHRRSVGDVDFALGAIDKAAVKKVFDPLSDRVLAAIKLGQADGVDWQTEYLGTALVLLDGAREIYPFTLEFGAPRLSLAGPLTPESINRSVAFGKAFAEISYLERVARLFVESSKRESDPLFAFVAAWSALEVFVGASFKNTYNKRWYAMLKGGVPRSAKPVIMRFEEVMSDKLRLADKFAVIAAILDADHAEADLAKFVAIKKVRDEFFHTPEAGGAPFPLDDTQALLGKYLRLHLSADLPC